MKKPDFQKYQPGTPEYVLAHAQWRKSRGRKPSMSLGNVRDPRKALKAACRHLPSRQTMLERLLRVSSEPHLVQHFYPRLLSNAGTTKQPLGVIMLLELAIIDYTEGIPVMYRVMHTRMESLIWALVIDEDARQETLQQYREIRELEQAATQEKASLAPPRPQLTDVEALELFGHAQRIGEIILSFYSPNAGSSDKPWGEDLRGNGVNPYYCQTVAGLYLEFYYSAPSYLWTPWGRWTIKGSSRGVSPAYVRQMLEPLTLELDTPVVQNEWGAFGPIYAVLAVEGVELPRPIKADQLQYLESETAKETWKRLNARYLATRAAV